MPTGHQIIRLTTDATGLELDATGSILSLASGYVIPTTTEYAGNAATATALATARAIGGVNFDGTAAITPTTIAVADTTDTTCYVMLVESATGNLLPKTDAGLAYNAGTGALVVGGTLDCGDAHVQMSTTFATLNIESTAEPGVARIQLTSKDSGATSQQWSFLNGASNDFVIQDSTAAVNVVTIIKGSPVNSFYVGASGGIGFGTTNASGAGVVVGSPTGGDKGAGTINAVGVYDDNVLLTDYVFDAHFNGQLRPGDDQDQRAREYEPMPVDMYREFLSTNRHLPGIKGRDEWEATGAPSTGEMISGITENVERLAILVCQQAKRIDELEAR